MTASPHALPQPICKMGYTKAQLEQILGPRLTEFNRWMYGQTGAICDGREYDHAAKAYKPTNCGPHGMVVYAHDLRQFLSGGRALD